MLCGEQEDTSQLLARALGCSTELPKAPRAAQNPSAVATGGEQEAPSHPGDTAPSSQQGRPSPRSAVLRQASAMPGFGTVATNVKWPLLSFRPLALFCRGRGCTQKGKKQPGAVRRAWPPHGERGLLGRTGFCRWKAPPATCCGSPRAGQVKTTLVQRGPGPALRSRGTGQPQGRPRDAWLSPGERQAPPGPVSQLRHGDQPATLEE